MRLDVTPRIDESEEAALRVVLAAHASPDSVSAWRRTALQEAVERAEPETYAFSPRSTRGATRA